MVQRPAFVARGEKVDGWWELTVAVVPGVLARVRRLEQGEAQVRHAVAAVLGIAPDSFDLRVVPVLPAELNADIARAREAAVEAVERQRRAAELSRSVVASLIGCGLTGADAAAVLGISQQRVSQLKGVPSRTPSAGPGRSSRP